MIAFILGSDNLIISQNALLSKSLAKWTRKLTHVNASFRLAFNLRFDGHPLAMTLVELKFVRKSTQVFHRLATQPKSTQVDRKWTV